MLYTFNFTELVLDEVEMREDGIGEGRGFRFVNERRKRSQQIEGQIE